MVWIFVNGVWGIFGSALRRDHDRPSRIMRTTDPSKETQIAGTTPRQMIERYWRTMNTNDWRAVGALLHDDYVLVWPQSGERIRGRENFIAVNAHYPAAGPWRFTVNRVIADEVGAASDVTVTDGARTDRAVSFFALRDDLIWQMTEFWPDPFEAAAWRAQWVEHG
jgi:ketosteroid isomerase-like protein